MIRKCSIVIFILLSNIWLLSAKASAGPEVVDQELLHYKAAALNCTTNRNEALNKLLEYSISAYGYGSEKHASTQLWVASHLLRLGDQRQAMKFLNYSLKNYKEYGAGPFNGMDTLHYTSYLDFMTQYNESVASLYTAERLAKRNLEIKQKLYKFANDSYLNTINQLAQIETKLGHPKKAAEYHVRVMGDVSERIKYHFQKGETVQWSTIRPYYEGIIDFVYYNDRVRSNETLNAVYNAILLSKSALLSAEMMGENYTYVTIEELKNKIGSEDICVEFFVTRKNDYGVIFMKKGWDSPKLIRLDKDTQSLPLTPTAYNSEIGRDRINHLSSIVWPNELIKHFPPRGKGKVYFSPIGKLSLTPIEYLPYDDCQYNSYRTLNDCFEMRRLSSTREVVRPKSVNVSKVGLLGGINYYSLDSTFNVTHKGKLSEYLRLRDEDFERELLRDSLNVNKGGVHKLLNGSLLEVSAIDSLYNQKSNIATGRFATHMILDSIALRSTSIHIATHSYDRSSVARNTLDDVGVLLAPSIIDNEVGKPAYVTATDISNKDWSNLSLAVLSICNSGTGTIQRDGIFGIERAFKLAGVKTLLVTLWPIVDISTSEFMEDFYKGLHDGDDIYSAFLKAHNNIRSNYPYEEYWCPFILIDAPLS